MIGLVEALETLARVVHDIDDAAVRKQAAVGFADLVEAFERDPRLASEINRTILDGLEES